MKNQIKKLSLMLFVLSTIQITSSCNKEKATLNKIEGTWQFSSVDYGEYLNYFESHNGTSDIYLWDSVTITFGSINNDGVGLITASGYKEIKTWDAGIIYTWDRYYEKNLIHLNYSISEDGKKLQFLTTTGMINREEDIISLKNNELVITLTMDGRDGKGTFTFHR